MIPPVLVPPIKSKNRWIGTLSPSSSEIFGQHCEFHNTSYSPAVKCENPPSDVIWEKEDVNWYGELLGLRMKAALKDANDSGVTTRVSLSNGLEYMPCRLHVRKVVSPRVILLNTKNK